MTAHGVIEDLFPSLIAGDVGAVLSSFDGRATVDAPLSGKTLPPEWMSETRAWLEAHDIDYTALSTLASSDGVAHECQLWLDVDGIRTELPVLLVAEIAEDRIRDLRIYHSTWPLTNEHMVRGPLRDPDPSAEMPEPVASYESALADGDVDAIHALFEHDGYVREPAGDRFRHSGPAREEFYGPLREGGGVALRVVSVLDDGTSVAVEYICDEWSGVRLDSQAGAVVCVRGASGKLAAVRVYDDIEPPPGRFD